MIEIKPQRVLVVEDDRKGLDDAVERRRDHLQPLDRGQHGTRGRDHAVAVEQGGGEDEDAV